MKILFDDNTPAPLAAFLRNYVVVRADQTGWQGLQNGALLSAAEKENFDLLLTCDQNIRYQQNLAGRKLAVVMLSSNHWPTLKPVADAIAAALDLVRTGQVIHIDVSAL